MRVLIADRSQMALAQLAQQLESQQVQVAHRAQSLVSVYDYAEHQQPDAVILSSDLAACAEFELLAMLFAILGITCIILARPGSAPLPPGAIRANPALTILPETTSAMNLALALRKDQVPRRSAAPVHPGPDAPGNDPRALILIGSSTGGVDALMQVLKHFNAHTPPVVIVQHTGGQFAASLIRLLGSATAAKVMPATHHCTLHPGHIYLPADDSHHVTLAPAPALRIRLDAGPRQSGHKPSVDALFFSALSHAPHVTAAILTGMGQDGAAGITALRQAGARTIGQDQTTSVVYGMPRVAKEMGGITTELPLPQIGPALLRAPATRLRAS
jgi:two-component system chemotaxis response regulator CheB